MAQPIVEYASSLWALHTLTNINQIEKEQLDFVTMISLDIAVLQQ